MTFSPEQLELLNEARQRLRQPEDKQDLSQANQEQLIALAKQRLGQQQEPQQDVGVSDVASLLFGAAPSIAARGLEGIVGLPGQIREGVTGLLESLGVPENITRGDPSALTGLGGPSPTPDELRDIEKQLVGDVFEPRNAVEAFAGDVAQDAAQLFAPLGNIQGLAGFRNLAASLGGNLVKQGLIQGLDVDEGIADLAKLPVYMISAGAFKTNKSEFINQSWKRVEELSENRVVTEGSGLVNRLKNFANQMRKGGTTEQQKLVLEKIEEFLPRIETGTFEFDELIEANKVINSSLRDFKTFDRDGRALLQGYKSIIGESIESLGTPDLVNAWKEANLASSALGAQNSLTNAFKNVFKKSDLSPTTQAILTYTFPKATGALKTAAFLKDRVDLLKRVMENPVARDFYIRSIQAALNNQTSLAIKNAKELDNIVKTFKPED